MDRRKPLPLMNSFSIILQLVGFIMIAISLISLYATLTDNWRYMIAHFPGLFHRGEIKPVAKQLGTFAEIAVMATAAFWLFKTLLIQVKKKNIWLPDVWNIRTASIFQPAMLFFKKNHRFLGWVTVILACGHGLYFLLFPDKQIKFFYTGLTALIGLVIVAGVGIVFDQLMKSNKAVKAGRRYHLTTAVIFAVLFLIHLYY
jgi:hypothetical protein